jgi:chorismate synthase
MGRLRFLTAGESHGPALAAIVEGVPAGLPLTADAIASDLARRQRGYGRGARSTSIERDRAEILGGVRHGLTIGSPIMLLIRNRDWANWTRAMQVEPLTDEEAAELAVLVAGGDRKATPITHLRAGHADLAGAVKYGFSDVRPILERASARETAARVAAGAVARALLGRAGIEVWSHTVAVGGVTADPSAPPRAREEAEASPLRCLDAAAEAAMIARIDEARSAGDTVGGVFELVATGVPIGLGSHVQWDRRLDGALAAAVMSIPIVKGVELGLGFEQTRRFGSAVMDVIEGRRDDGEWARRTNNAGGLEGGISNGQPIVLRGAVKPISTLPRPLPSADLVTGEPVEKGHYERSDICVVPATGVVAEATVCLTLADHLLDKFGGDSLAETLDNLARYRARSAAAASTGTPGAATGPGAPGAGPTSAPVVGSAAPAESE